MEKTVERLPVIMVCDYIDKQKVSEYVKQYPISDEFYIRNYKKGDETLWSKIETDAGEFKTEKEAIERFEKEFGSYRDEMERRCFFVVHKESGLPVGTATAWYNDNFQGLKFGRVHWVGIHPEFQGKKLAKPMLSVVMTCLSKYHDKAYLTSQTTSYKAINMYLDFGFVPEITSDVCVRAWKCLEDILGRKIPMS